jgi:DNA-binding SARP family transcriptional activator/ABC-type transport system substrate-binding protein/streptogramin lyase
MEFRLLGPVEAVRDGGSLTLGGAKPRALLGFLLIHANEVVSRDRLIEALWGDRPPGTADHSLDVQVSRLRKVFEPDDVLLTRSGGYVLEVDRERIDVHRFERMLEEGRRANAAGDSAAALATLSAALGLWRGPAFADLAYESFAQTEIERLEELRLVAVEERIEAELALGQHDKLVPELESLTAKYPLRERLRGQLMLALYRSGRQAEALRVYTETRRQLVDDLGIEPSESLRALEQAILKQDPALAPPRPRAAGALRRRRALFGVATLVLAGAAVAAVVGMTRGGTENARALAEADSDVFLSAQSGELVRTAAVRDTVRLAFDKDAVWSISSTGDLTRLDPSTGKEVARLGLGIKPAGLAVGEGLVWVTDRNSPTLYRIDPSVNEQLEPFQLPMKGVVTDLTGEVAVGAGSVFVGHGAFNPGAWVEQLDAKTGRLHHRFPILAGDADHLAFADGALWVASTPSGELRKIDPRTEQPLFTRQLQAQLCCVAAGDGYVWAASNPEGKIWKVAANGSVLGTINLGSPVESLTYADGALWAALGDDGTAVRIDPTTDQIRRYDLGHSVTSVSAHDDLVAAGVRHSIEDVTGDLSGDVVWIGRKGNALFDSGAPVEPAFTSPTWDAPQGMFHYVTCARLLNYADVEGDAGRRLVPDAAEDFPEVSDGGRTFTFRIRKGFGFSPPSTQDVTAESFRHAVERAVKITKLFGDPLSPPASNIVGAQDYYSGKTLHIAGVSANGDELVFRFVRPEPDLPWLAASLSCAVPVPTPVVKGGLDKPVPSAGPYYLATLTDSVAVLRPNPNYGGTRPQHLDAIVVEFDVPPAEAATRIQNGTLDYFFESQQATLTPDTAAARAAGPNYRITPSNGVQFYAFNDGRPLFADIRMRRAVQYALDRSALLAASPSGTAGVAATRLLHPSIVGYDERQLYPLHADLRTARELAGGRGSTVDVWTWDDPYTEAFNKELRKQLGAIGLRMSIVKAAQSDSQAEALAKIRRSDLIWGGLSEHSADPGDYLKDLVLPPGDARELRRIQSLSSPNRERAALALVHKLERKSLFAVFQMDGMPELWSRRLGCIVHQPEYPGIDLAALCLKKSGD